MEKSLTCLFLWITAPNFFKIPLIYPYLLFLQCILLPVSLLLAQAEETMLSLHAPPDSHGIRDGAELDVPRGSCPGSLLLCSWASQWLVAPFAVYRLPLYSQYAKVGNTHLGHGALMGTSENAESPCRHPQQRSALGPPRCHLHRAASSQKLTDITHTCRRDRALPIV